MSSGIITRTVMKHFVALVVLSTLMLGVPAMGADDKPGKKKTKEPAVDVPQFPKQSVLNAALVALARAQQAFDSGDRNPAEVLKHLESAVEKLNQMMTKGNHPLDCRRHTELAIKHLKAGEMDKVADDLEKAMKSGIRAGEVGSQGKGAQQGKK